MKVIYVNNYFQTLIFYFLIFGLEEECLIILFIFAWVFHLHHHRRRRHRQIYLINLYLPSLLIRFHQKNIIFAIKFIFGFLIPI
jgi:hypothetical protein